MGVYYDKKRHNWRAELMIDGKRIRKRGFSERKYAEMWAADQKRNHEMRSVGLDVRENIEIFDVCQGYLSDVKRYKTKGSSKRDLDSLKNWLNFCEHKGIEYVREINSMLCHDYMDWRSGQVTNRGESPSDRTLQIELGTLNRALNFAVEHGIIKENPIKKLPKFKKKKLGVPRYLTLEEIKIVEDAAKKDKRKTCFYESIAILVRTGMRTGELCSLDASNIDFEREQIVLRPDQTKAQCQRVIPMQPVVKDILIDLVERAEKEGRKNLIHTRSGKSQTQYNIVHRFRSLMNELGNKIRDSKELHPHSLRRTFISHMIMQGVDPVKVMAWVGHQDWATIKRYLALSKEYVGEVEKLPY